MSSMTIIRRAASSLAINWRSPTFALPAMHFSGHQSLRSPLQSSLRPSVSMALSVLIEMMSAKGTRVIAGRPGKMVQRMRLTVSRIVDPVEDILERKRRLTDDQRNAVTCA